MKTDDKFFQYLVSSFDFFEIVSNLFYEDSWQEIERIFDLEKEIKMHKKYCELKMRLFVVVFKHYGHTLTQFALIVHQNTT